MFFEHPLANILPGQSPLHPLASHIPAIFFAYLACNSSPPQALLFFRFPFQYLVLKVAPSKMGNGGGGGGWRADTVQTHGLDLHTSRTFDFHKIAFCTFQKTNVPIVLLYYPLLWFEYLDHVFPPAQISHESKYFANTERSYGYT